MRTNKELINIKKLFTFKEVVQLSGILPGRLRVLIQRNQIHYEKIGSKILFDLLDLIEIRAIVKLNLTPSIIAKIQSFFDDNRQSKTLSDKRLIIFDGSIYYAKNLDDITEILNNGIGQKVLGQIILPDLYCEIREQARVLNIENYSLKFNQKIS